MDLLVQEAEAPGIMLEPHLIFSVREPKARVTIVEPYLINIAQDRAAPGP